ncbi:MAG: hypothetical protein IT257_02075, partial [Chitinophagaceae bacterium]|nr:hypothetical protein [Chitinophagaceae bacterium]
MDNYQLLIARLDSFIRKFYANKLIRGLLIFLASAIAFYVLASLGEYYFYFPSWLRYALLIVFIGIGGFALVYLIMIPLLQMQKLGKVISHEKAAAIIGTHFPDVQDKLLNVLQLKQGLHNTISKDLIAASIEQKTKELTPVHFQAAVNFATNKRYLPYVLPPMLVLIFMLFAAPNIFRESAQRLLSPSEKFVPKAPFTFKILNKDLNVPQFDDIEIVVQTLGKTVPENVLIKSNGQEIMMQKKQDSSNTNNGNTFSHTFFKVSKNIEFSLSAAGFESERFMIKTLQKPVIKQFKVSVDYPDYTGRKDETLDNIGDIIAPQGTTLRWVFSTEHTDQMQFALGSGTGVNMPTQMNQFFYNYRFMKDTSYNIIISNKQVSKKDTMHYTVSVIPDQFPSINVQQYND